METGTDRPTAGSSDLRRSTPARSLPRPVEVLFSTKLIQEMNGTTGPFTPTSMRRMEASAKATPALLIMTPSRTDSWPMRTVVVLRPADRKCGAVEGKRSR